MLAVSVPKIRADRPRAAEVRPRRVEGWLNGLSGQEPREIAQQLHQALFAQNRVALDEENRLRLLELFQSYVGDVVGQLQQSYLSAPLPFSDRQRTFFSQSFRLFQELAYGYKIVASDLVAQGRSAARPIDLVLSIQRAVFYISKLLLNHYQCYEATPNGSWRELHQLYKYAEGNNLLTQPAATPRDPDTAELEGLMSIHDAYQQIVIVGAVNPYGLLPGECLRLYKLAGRWHSLAHLSTHINPEEPAGHFLLSLIGDHPPLPVIKATKHNNEEHLRVLSTMEIVKEVHRGLKHIEKNGRFSNELLGHVDSRDTDFLKRLGRSLGAIKVRRRSTRARVEKDIEICIGVNAIHYFASGEKQFTSPNSIPNGSPKNNKEAELQPVTIKISDDEYIDLSDPGLPVRAREHPDDVAKKLDAQGAAAIPWQQGGMFRLYRALAKDESAGGLRLMLNAPTDVHLRVGDLVGLRYPTPDRWRASVVRWIRNPQPEIMEAGLQLLAPELNTAAVRRASDNGEQHQYFQALLLPENIGLKLPASVLLPSGTYRLNEPLEINSSDKSQVVIAQQCLEQNGSFDQLVVGTAEAQT